MSTIVVLDIRVLVIEVKSTRKDRALGEKAKVYKNSEESLEGADWETGG